jgi:peptide/nickel transport system permease protein/oligopeptide transport system permease protein
MAAPLEVSPVGTEVAPESVVAGLAGRRIEGRSLGQIAWLRLRRDRVAMAGGIFVLLLILVAAVGPFVVQNPNIYNPRLINSTLQGPNGAFGGISGAHWLGVEPQTGRDMLARVVDGAWVSLLIGFLSALLAVAIGVFFGLIAGYFGGWLDTLIGRLMDVFLAFPVLVFALALVGVFPTTAKVAGFTLSGNVLRISMLIFIIGFFNWPYMGRIIRGQVLSMREREFVDAARSMGGRGPYILVRELLPNLWGPILVVLTLLIPTNILFEAALSYLGVGIIPPQPSWGGMLSNAVTNGYYYIDPMYMVIPGLAIFLTVMAFNLFGDGLRDALDPKTR